MGQVAPFVVPLAVTLFLFILIANWLELIPTRGNLEPPSADINLTLALALTVIVWVHITAHPARRVWGPTCAHYAQPYPALIPLDDHRARSSSRSRWPCDSSATSSPAAIMLAIIGLIPACAAVAAERPLEGLRPRSSAPIQAFIFALLTILYFGFALEEEEH